MTSCHRFWFLLLVCLCSGRSFASAYNARPKLIVSIVIDEHRGNYLERYRDQFGGGGFQLSLDRGRDFTECNYDYANTSTAPGHATLLSGAYTDDHGILANGWWDTQKKRMVTSVLDENTTIVGEEGGRPGASPHNLLASTLGDELKLASLLGINAPSHAVGRVLIEALAPQCAEHSLAADGASTNASKAMPPTAATGGER